MKRQISRISPVQSAKVIALFSFIVALPFWILSAVPVIALPGPRPPFFGTFIFLMPVLSAASSFVLVVVAAALYNVLAKYTGGIEFTSVDIG